MSKATAPTTATDHPAFADVLERAIERVLQRANGAPTPSAVEPELEPDLDTTLARALMLHAEADLVRAKSSAMAKAVAREKSARAQEFAQTLLASAAPLIIQLVGSRFVGNGKQDVKDRIVAGLQGLLSSIVENDSQQALLFELLTPTQSAQFIQLLQDLADMDTGDSKAEAPPKFAIDDKVIWLNHGPAVITKIYPYREAAVAEGQPVMNPANYHKNWMLEPCYEVSVTMPSTTVRLAVVSGRDLSLAPSSAPADDGVTEPVSK